MWFPSLGVSAFRRKAASLPPHKPKQKDVRCLDIHENDRLDEDQFADGVKQAVELLGWGGA